MGKPNISEHPLYSRYYISAFHVASHSILTTSHEIEIIFHILYTVGEETQCSKDWQTLRKCISLLPVHTCRLHFPKSLAGVAMGMSPDQEELWSTKTPCDPSFSLISMSQPEESWKSHVEDDRDTLGLIPGISAWLVRKFYCHKPPKFRGLSITVANIC